MKKFFRTWIDWWLFVPIGFALGIGSYWFVPFLLGKLGVPEHDMQYTGTAWIYSLFQAILIFTVGLGITFITYRWFFPGWHKYLEDNQFELDSDEIIGTSKVVLALAIPAILFISFCILCLAVFQ